jgi:hypothetical protein
MTPTTILKLTAVLTLAVCAGWAVLAGVCARCKRGERGEQP